MALKKVFDQKSVYVRVDRVICGKTVQIPDFLVGVYEEVQGEDSVELRLQTKMHFAFDESHQAYATFSPNSLSQVGMNPLKAAYEYLKTLPVFADYVDA